MTDNGIVTSRNSGLSSHPRTPEPPIVGPPPPFDPECLVALDAVRDLVPTSVTPDTISSLRATDGDSEISDDDLLAGGAYTFFERNVPGPEGSPDITLLICLPSQADRPVPAIYHVHGGGLISGNRRSALHVAADLARSQGMAIVSVEYRLAPEHQHPAPVEDCYAGLSWLSDHANELGIDPDRLIVYGISGGCSPAAGVVLLARDRGAPSVFGQMLLTPMIDDRNDSASAIQMAGLGVWDRTANQTGWSALLGDRQGGPDVPIYAAPARATDLSGLPNTFIDVGSAETFRDEAVAYASRIWQSGGRAELHVWPGGFHGYDVFAPTAAISVSTVLARKDWLRRSLGGGTD